MEQPSWGTTNNNGNLQGETLWKGGPAALNSLLKTTQSYGYDTVNRLTAASDSSGWSRQFGYDAWGNMWVTSNSGVTLAGNTPTSNNAYNGNNQIAATSYDNAGNTFSVNGFTLGYDAENRQVTATEQPSLGGGQELYLYDGAGQRVEKIAPAGNTIYVYDAFGQLAAQYNTFGSVFACSTCYVTTDHLGSVRMVTDQNGAAVTRHDYLPFGEEIQGSSPSSEVEQRFTGQIRDTETGIDFFNARYFTAPLGRFNSADPESVGADLSDPQTWNGYGYVRNSPLALTDPSGQFLSAAAAGSAGGPIGAGIGLVVDIFEALFGLFGGGGGSAAAPPPPPPPPPVSSYPGGEASGLPPGSFPGRENLGLPPGMIIAGPFGIPGGRCDFGPCLGSPLGNGFLNPVAVGAGGTAVPVFIDNVWVVLVDVGGGAICVGSGACEVIAAGAGVVALGAGAYIIYKKVSKKSGKETASDTPSWVSHHPPKGPNESCAEFAARVLTQQYGTGHAKATRRGPGSEFSQIKKACERGGL